MSTYIDRMPQCVCYFQKKVPETFSYHWKNSIISAHTRTRQGADSDHYGSSTTEVLISHSFSVETISIEPGSKPSSLEFVSILQE